VIALKLWFDTRFRFYIGLAVMIVLALVLAWAVPAMSRMMITGIKNAPPSPGVTAEAKAAMLQIWGSYEMSLDTNWYGVYGGGSVGLLAIIMALGGPLAEPHSVHLTLSLPVRRYRWPIAQAVLTIGLTVTMLLVSTAVLMAVGALLGHTYPPGRAALNVLLCVVPNVAWVGLTLAVGSYTLDTARTALVVIPARIISVPLLKLPFARAWDLGSLGRPISMHPALTWRPLLLLIVCAVGGVALAARRFQRLDY